MDSRLREHYYYLWQLTQVVKNGLLESLEEKKVIKLLKEAVISDANLSSLDIQADNFLDQLSLKLEALYLSKPETKSSLPPKEILQNAENLAEKALPKIPFVFRDELGKAGFFSHHPEVYSILKRHNLVDKNGNFNLTNTTAVAQAQRDISLFLTAQLYRQTLKEKLTLALEKQKVPLILFRRPFFGEREIPGIINRCAEEIVNQTNIALFQKIEQYLGGPIDTTANGFQAAFNRAVEDIQAEIFTGKLNFTPKIQEIIETHFGVSPTYSRLNPTSQNELKYRTLQAINQGFIQAGAPQTIEEIKVEQEPGEKDAKAKSTLCFYQNPKRIYQKFTSHPLPPREIRERVIYEFNLPENIIATKHFQDLIESFCKDPISALLYYPFYSVLQLLPVPIKNLAFKNTGWQKTWENLKAYYAVTTNAEAQRLFIQDLLWKGFKKSLQPFGLTNQKGQWIWASVISYVGDRSLTGFGEGLAKISQKIPLIGNFLSRTFRRRLGKKRSKDENLLANVLSILLDITTALIAPVTKLAWKLINKIPAVQKFQAFISQKWANFYYSLESKFPIFKYLRIGKGVTRGFIKAIPHGLVTGGLGYLASGGQPGWAIGLGSLDLLFHLLKNLGKIQEIVSWATGSHGSLLGEFLGKLLKVANHPLVYLPIKSPLLSWFITTYILPQFGVNLPLFVRFLVSSLIGGLEYSWVVGVKPWLAAHIPPVIAKYMSGPLGRLLQRIGELSPGFFIGTQLAIYYNLPFQKVLGAGLIGAGIWKILITFFPKIFSFNLFGLLLGLPIGHWLVAKLGLVGPPAVLLPWATSIGFSLLWKFGLTALGNWLWSALGLPSLEIGAGLGSFGGAVAAAPGTFTSAIAALATLLIAILAILVIITLFAAFFLQTQEVLAPPTSECFAPQKTVEILDKNTRQLKSKAEAGDILRYTLNYGVKKEEVKNVVLKDEFREAEMFVSVIPTRSWNKIYLDSESFLIKQEPTPHNGPKRVIEQRSMGEGFGFQESWYRVIWENFSVTPTTPPIVYEIRVSDKYKSGSIINQILLNGEWSEITPEGKERKAKCQVAITSYVNSETKESAELAIKIINELHKCEIEFVNRNNLSSHVEPCLFNAGVPPVVIEQFQRSVNSFENLQCVGFISALEAATGGNLQNINLKNAKSYWRELDGYQRKYRTKENKNNLNPGDILIWTNTSDGHMAMVVQPIFDSDGQLAKIIIAEAMGNNGKVRLREITYDNPGLAGWQRRK